MSKPDEYDFCFGCEYLNKKHVMYWNVAVCTFNGDDDNTFMKRVIKTLDKCPKEKAGEQE